MQLDEELTEFYQEDDEPIKCPKCGNTKDWIICFSKVYAEVRGKEVFTSGQKPITKPDDLLWICGNSKCKCLVLDTLW